MASGGSSRRGVVAAGLVVAFALGCGRQEKPREAPAPNPDASPAAADSARVPEAPFPDQEFFVGAWCSPRTDTTDPELWRAYARDGLTLAVRPLEDTNDRTLNLRMLTMLDTLVVEEGDGVGTPQALVRDDAVHPDETSRPGWRERVKEVVAAYRGHRSLAGYFVADEPPVAMFDLVADVCRAFAGEDSLHPAYVNVLALQPNASPADQAKWRADVTRLITRGKLRMFSTDPYAHTAKGEDAGFLLTLQNARQVALETGCAFAPVLQFTGYADRDPVSPAVASYLASESVAYGASGIVWFTYWTPTPADKDMRWRGGAIDYDGTRTARANAMSAANKGARRAARWLKHGTFVDPVGHPGAQSFPRVGHFGGSMPRGAPVASSSVFDLAGTSGGPITVAAVPMPASTRQIWLVINRDVETQRRITLTFDLPSRFMVQYAHGGDAGGDFEPFGREVSVVLEPGGSTILSRMFDP